MKPIEIDKHVITPGGRTLVIAEIGVNHDGRLDRAMQLVQAAAQCGADAVKLQIFSARRLMHPSCAFADYQRTATDAATSADMLRQFELGFAELQTIVAEIRRLGMIPLATPFSTADVETVEALELAAIKIASPDLVNWPLLRQAARSGRPLIVSTGAATLDEIEMAVNWLQQWNAPFALLHCVSSYPTPGNQANLCWIGQLSAKFHVPVGYSDHTDEISAGALAVSAGACVLEKHITLDRAAVGPDHSASFDPVQFAQYVRMIRLAEQMRGSGGKRVLEIERDVRTVSRQSLVAARDLAPGSIILEQDLMVQRPGTGIPASAMPDILGRRIARWTQAGEMLTWQVLAEAA